MAGCSATENLYDTVSPSGKVMMTILCSLAQFERETLAERVHDNMMALAKTGRWLGGTTPTGYESEKMVGSYTVDGKPRSMYKLKIKKEEANKIQLIFDKFLETNSMTKVETYLLHHGIKTKNNKNYTRFAIRMILENPVYMTADEQAWEFFRNRLVEVYTERDGFNGKHGIMAYNKTSQNKGTSNKSNVMRDWIIAVGKHSPLISSCDWIRVQEMIEKNKPKSYRKAKNNTALLSGLLKCKNCQSYMRPKTDRGVTGHGEKRFHYLCEMKEKSRMERCGVKNAQGNELDTCVCNEIKKMKSENSEFKKRLKTVRKTIERDSATSAEKIKETEKQIREIEKEINEKVNGIPKCENSVASAYLIKQIEKLHEDKKRILIQLEELHRQREAKQRDDSSYESVKRKLYSFAGAFDTLSMEQKRDSLRIIIEEIFWNGEEAHIYLIGAKKEQAKCEPDRLECK